MQLDFAIQSKRLQSLGVVLSPEEMTVINAAIPAVRVEFDLIEATYFARIQTLKRPYHILLGKNERGDELFYCSADMTAWSLLPALDQEEIQELQRLGFGIASRVPLFGKLDKLLPKEEVAEEEEEKPDEEEEPKEEDGEEPKEKVAKVIKEKPRKFKLLESHRLSQIIQNVHKQMQIVLLDAFCKQSGKQVLNTQFRGLQRPNLSNLALLKDYEKYLNGTIQQNEIKTLQDEPNSNYYTGQFDVLNGCLVVRNFYYKGLIYYIYANALVWGSFYDGDGIAW
ncbi:Conserved_hypothetical protein [Hexamita inflata]|uniref:Radial spoke head protein 9 homolog n=1 Tax=Hexamita inflata TaxID=28002 RepID=A0AA86TN83_9EUKA|nr:Conserved hypothetical protein [Hexamita inflata]